jgi:putative phosphoribosyl transferase
VLFKDQVSAGEKLAEELREYRAENAVILAIPRGGVATGYGLAKKLKLPLDVIVTRKIGAPDNSELAIGAMGETEGSLWLNKHLVADLKVSDEHIKSETKIQKLEIKRRERVYRQGKRALDLKKKTVILVDDGLATGATMIAAVREIRNMAPEKIVVAVPVAPSETVEELRKEADEVICLQTPALFFAVGQWYQNFKQYSDEEVIKFLAGK